MKVICVLFVIFLAKGLYAQDDEDGPYRGKFLGKFNSYHHQVAGEVYAVDESTLLLVHFNYDGTGDDTFFWAGDSGRPGPQGFIVPDENGKTNILERYLDSEIRISLPEGKRISSIKWLAIYDIATQNTFADLFVPEELDAPRARTLPPLAGDPRVTSGPIRVLDADTLLISGLKFPGSSATDTEAFFACGTGAQPHSRGHKLPDEYGYLEPLPAYNGTDVKLNMPGGVSLLTVEWCGIIDYRGGVALAYTALREALTVPPSTRKLTDYKTQLPNCRQLHRDMQVSWELFGEQLTIQLAGKIGENDYMAFGISGSTEGPQMLGADVAVVSFDTHTQRVYADDYNITDKGPCISVLGAWRGVCADTQLGGLSNQQPLSGSRKDGLSTLTYRTQLKPAESMDREWPTNEPVQVVWAIGVLNPDRKPTFHSLYPKYPVTISVNGPPTSDCVPFTTAPPQHPPRLPTPQLDATVRTFYCTLAPPPPSSNQGPALVWYINGLPQPTITLTRHLHYTFYILGGDEPHSATLYHPLTISKDQDGSPENAIVGVATSRRNRPAPTHAGPLCIGKLLSTLDRRRWGQFPTARALNRSLEWECPSDRTKSKLDVSPDNSWPNTVYYHSFTHPDMGGKILVVDRPKRSSVRRSAASLTSASVTSLIVSLASLFALVR